MPPVSRVDLQVISRRPPGLQQRPNERLNPHEQKLDGGIFSSWRCDGGSSKGDVHEYLYKGGVMLEAASPTRPESSIDQEWKVSGTRMYFLAQCFDMLMNFHVWFVICTGQILRWPSQRVGSRVVAMSRRSHYSTGKDLAKDRVLHKRLGPRMLAGKGHPRRSMDER